MGPLPHLLVPDSSAKALIAQQRSSSSPTSSIDSPIEPRVPVASPSPPSPHFCNPQVDPSLPASSSSSSNLVPEIQPVPQSKAARHRRRTQERHVHKKDKQDERLEYANQERTTQRMPRRDSPHFQKKRKGCQDNVCCKCAAAFTADCAAVCCCPLALLHLAALAFIRLPTAVAWKMLVNLKNKIYPKRRSTKTSEEDSPRPNASTWSCGSSPEEGGVDPGAHAASFDTENLWQHFEGSGLDFGGLSMRREPQ